MYMRDMKVFSNQSTEMITALLFDSYTTSLHNYIRKRN